MIFLFSFTKYYYFSLKNCKLTFNFQWWQYFSNIAIFIIYLSNILTMSVQADKFYSRNVRTKTKLDIYVFMISFYILFIRVGGFIGQMIIIVPENLVSFLVLYVVRALFLLLSLALMFGLLFHFLYFSTNISWFWRYLFVPFIYFVNVLVSYFLSQCFYLNW